MPPKGLPTSAGGTAAPRKMPMSATPSSPIGSPSVKKSMPPPPGFGTQFVTAADSRGQPETPRAPATTTGAAAATAATSGAAAAAEAPLTAAKLLVDPFLNLPYATVPPTLLPVFEGCGKLAAFLIAATNQMVAGTKKPQVAMLTAESVYLMKPTGEIVRRLSYASIRAIVTNADAAAMPAGAPEQQQGGDGAGKFQAFALFLMAETEKTDVMFVENGVLQIVSWVKKILHATQAAPIRFEVVSARKASEVGVVYREPQSQRDGIGENDRSRLQTREAVAQLYYEQVVAKDEAAAARALGSLGGTSDSAAFIRNQAALRGEGQIVSKRDEVSNLPYARIPVDYEHLYPRLKSPEYALLWFGPVFHYFITREQDPGRPRPASNLQFRHAFLTCERLYVGDAEDRYLRCARLENLNVIFVPDDIGILKPKVSLPDDAVNHCTCGLVLMWRGEHDLFLGFVNIAQRQTFVAVLNAVLRAYYPTMPVRMQRCSDVLECRASLDTPLGFTAAVIEVPKRHGSAPSLTPAGVAAASERTLAAAPQRSFGQGPPLPIVEPEREVLLAHPPLVRCGVIFAGYVALHNNPLQPATGITMTAAFLTETHMYLGSKGTVLRCVPLDKVQKLLLKGAAVAQSQQQQQQQPTQQQSKRNFLLVVCEPPEHDFMIEFKSIDVAKQLLTSYIQATKKNFPAHRPTLGSFDEVQDQSVYRYTPYPTYRLNDVPPPPHPQMTAHAERLARIYEKYEPSKVDGIDTILINFRGNEATMFKKLVEKYGPEPPAPSPQPEVQQAQPTAAASSSMQQASYEERLRRFCVAYCPEKLPEVDAVLQRHVGIEEQLFAKLVARYGPEPPADAASGGGAVPTSGPPREEAAPLTLRERLVRFYEKYEPSKVTTVDGILTTFRGEEASIMPKLVAKYGPEPPPPTAEELAAWRRQVPPQIGEAASPPGPIVAAATASSAQANPHRERLVRFYNRYDPSKVASVDTILQAYVGNENELFGKLVAKYGPEPVPSSTTTTQLAPNAVALDPNAPSLSYKERLTQFTAKYMPQKLHMVDDVLLANAGNEEAMMRALVAKYGPEPTATVAAAPTAAAGAAAGAPGGAASPQRPPVLNGAERGSPTSGSGEPQQLAASNFTVRSRARLARFYQQYDPSKATAENIDSVLARYAGTEEELFAKLVAKYGPEPVDTSRFAAPSDVYQSIDMTADLAFADIPPEDLALFPSLTSAAIYWFGKIGHWEPPAPPARRYAFLTRSHLYVADHENLYYRCVPILSILCLFINSKRLDKEAQCAMLVKLHPQEHDLFMSFPSDFAAKKLMWVILEIVNRFHFSHNIPACAVASLSEPGIEPQCERGEHFRLDLKQIPKRPMIGEVTPTASAERVGAAAGARDGETRRKVPTLTKNAMFGSVPHVSDWVAERQRAIGGETNLKFLDAPIDGLPDGQSDLRGSPASSALARGINPLQAEQFARHTDDGTFGRVPGFTRPPPGAMALSNFFVEHEIDLDGNAIGSAANGEKSAAAAPEVFVNDEQAVHAFLKSLDLEHFAPLFAKKRITLATLQTYNAEDLKHFGVAYEADRIRILDALRDESVVKRARGEGILGDSGSALIGPAAPRRPVGSRTTPNLGDMQGSDGFGRTAVPPKAISSGAFTSAPPSLSSARRNVLGSSAFFAEMAPHQPKPVDTPRSVLETIERAHDTHAGDQQRFGRPAVLTPAAPSPLMGSIPAMPPVHQSAGVGSDFRAPFTVPPVEPRTANTFSSPLQSAVSSNPLMGHNGVPLSAAYGYSSPFAAASQVQSGPRGLEFWGGLAERPQLTAGSIGAPMQQPPPPPQSNGSATVGGRVAAPPPPAAPSTAPREPWAMGAPQELGEYGFVSLLPSDRSPSPRRLTFEDERATAVTAALPDVPPSLRDNSAAAFDIHQQLALLREVDKEKKLGEVAARSYAALQPPLSAMAAAQQEAAISEGAARMQQRQQAASTPFFIAQNSQPAAALHPQAPPMQPNATAMQLPPRDMLPANSSPASAPQSIVTSSFHSPRPTQLRQPQLPAQAAAQQSPASPVLPINLNELTVEDVGVVLDKLGIGEHRPSFSRTDGRLLASLGKDDVRHRFRGDSEAADILWEWLGRRRQRMALVQAERQRVA